MSGRSLRCAKLSREIMEEITAAYGRLPAWARALGWPASAPQLSEQESSDQTSKNGQSGIIELTSNMLLDAFFVSPHVQECKNNGCKQWGNYIG